MLAAAPDSAPARPASSRPFGRLRKVLNRGNDALVAEYRYNGLGYLIAIHEDTDGDGDVDSSDAWRRFVYDHRWRVVAEHQNAETTPRLFSVHHAAGLDGRGTGSYIDQVVCRERKVVFTGSLGNAQPTAENPNPTAPANERLYYCQNRRADVVALVTSSGRQVEQARYSAYGVPFGLPMGDTDGDGDVDAADLTQIQSWIDHSIYDVRGDLDLDGDVDAADKSIASALSGTTLGRGVLTRSTIGNRSGYGGYLYHGTVLKYHVRNRVYDPYTGRWLTRDPIGYVSTANLYLYADGAVLFYVDPFGLHVITVGRFPPGWIKDYCHDFVEGCRELKDTWKDIFDDPSKYREWAGDDGAIDEVQAALDMCACIPGAEQIVAPISIGLDLIQGDCAGAGQTLVCAAIPGPGGGSGPVRGVTPGSSPRLPGIVPVRSRPPTMKPDPDAQGPHCTLVREGKNQDGPVKKYQEWWEKENRHPNDPHRWRPGKRYDEHGPPHDGVPTPHIHDPDGTVRPPMPDEKPRR